MNLAGKYFMKGITISSKCNTTACINIGNINSFININNIFAFWMYLKINEYWNQSINQSYLSAHNILNIFLLLLKLFSCRLLSRLRPHMILVHVTAAILPSTYEPIIKIKNCKFLGALVLHSAFDSSNKTKEKTIKINKNKK